MKNILLCTISRKDKIIELTSMDVLIFVNYKIIEDFSGSRLYTNDCIIGLIFFLSLLYYWLFMLAMLLYLLHMDKTVWVSRKLMHLPMFNPVRRIQLFYDVNFLISSPIQYFVHYIAIIFWWLDCIIQNGADLLL